MKTLRVTVQICALLCGLSLVAGAALASPLTLSGSLLFSSLDGSAQDSDGLANGVFTVSGDLVIDGTISCNDDVPLPMGASACPIRISVSGDLTLEAGSGLFAENRRGSGDGGNIRLDVGGDLTLLGPDASLPGAVVSTSRTTGTVGTAGSLTAEVVGAVDLQAGSALAASSQGGSAGAITVTGETVRVAGLVASGGSRTVLSTFLSGKALDGGNSGQAGGTIHLRALGSTEPGLRIEPEGVVVSQGEGGGGRLVLLEACGIEVRGLVASLSKNNGPSQVALRSGKGILVDGRDLGSAAPAEGRFGRVRADGTQQGAAGYLVDLFAASEIQVLGPAPSATGLFAVSSTPGDQPLRNAGGTITAISLDGTLNATGNAFETGRDIQGDKGGVIDLQARGDVTLDGATVRAVGGFTSTMSANVRAGGHIDVRSFQGAVSWTFGVGDVRPTGTGVPAARRGTIEMTACSTVDTTGTQFPVSGSAVPPFPVENEGVCSPAAPSLPDGEPPLPVCAPPNQPPAPSGGPFSIAENSANGTVVGTVLANDPDAGQTHTFSILAGNTGGAFAIDSSTGEFTVADSTALDFETTPSFSLTVEATDNGTPALSGTGTVVVNLTDINEPPMPSGGPFTISENSPNGTVVGTVSAGDQDAGQSHTFSILMGNTNGAFAIDATGQITVANSAALDFETTPTFTLTVQATDNGSPALSGSASVVIHLLNSPEAPIAVDEGTLASPYVETVGNTILEVTASSTVAGAKIVFNGNVLANDVDPDGPTTFTATLESSTAGAVVNLHTDGTFTYLPPPGFTGVDSFTYRATDPQGQFDTATVYVNVEHRVWYVKNDATADGLGRSTDPFDTLAEAESASGAGDTIYLFEGDSTTSGQSDGITLKNGQRLIGEAVQLTAPATVNINGVDGPTLRSTIGNRPKIENDDTPNASGEDNGVSVPAIAGNMMGVEVRGLEISGFDNAIDVTATGANTASVDIRDNVVTGASLEGIDVNAGSTGTVTLAIRGNILTATGTAIDIQRTAGTVYITGFDNNVVSGNTGGTGISILGAVFDAAPGGSFDTVNGLVTVIGAPGDGVGQAGMVLTSVQGSLSFSDLDIFADSGAGLRVSGAGGGMTFGVLPGVSIIEATGGPAVDASSVALSLPLSSIKSTNSPTTGLALNSVAGTFSAGSGSSISNITSAAGTAFQVGSSSATVSYAGTITTTQGKGVDLTSNSGTISFTGTLTLSSGSQTTFNATGGGTVTATDTASTLDSTTGTALNVANTTIGSGGLHFRRISAGTGAGSGGNGISLDSTGTGGGNGGLVVHGSGTAGSGGTIQHKTGGDGSTTSGIGIYLRNTKAPSFDRMQLNHFDNFAILGNGVQGFTLTNSVINGVNGNNDGFDEGAVRFDNLLVSGLIDNCTIEGGVEGNIRVVNNTGTLNALVVQNSTIRNNSTTTGGDGIFARAQTGATMAVKVLNSTLYGHRDDHIATDAENSGVMTTVITGNTLTSNGTVGAAPQPSTLGGQITVTGGAAFASTSTFNISNNVITGAVPAPITVNVTSTTSTAGGLLSGTISGNQLGQAGSANSGSSSSDGMSVIVNGAATVNATITNNQIRQFNNIGIQFIKRDGSGNMNLTVTGNTVAEPVAPNALQGILVTSGATSGPPADSGTVCADIGGAGALANIVTGPNFGGDLVRVRQRFATIVQLPGFGGGATDTAAVVSYLIGRNTITNEAPNAKASATTQAPGSFAGGAACTAGAVPL